MKKLLFPIFVLLAFLHPRTTFSQGGRPSHQAEMVQHIYSPVQADIQSDCFDLDDMVIDISDDNDNDCGKKIYSFQNSAFSTNYLVARPSHDHFYRSKWVAQNNLDFQSPLFILFRAIRI